ncbi:MAG: DUF1465 family protein [Rickettsiales bacterium]|nr:DUF1465 family protein [Rickettsiales bacterium]
MFIQAAPDLQQDGNLLFLPSLFHETIEMIMESYEYFEEHEQLDPNSIPPFLQSIYSTEMSRITMRLTSVMAWLMARKAVSTGQITAEEAESEYALDDNEFCLNHNHELTDIVPYQMNDLLVRSHAIYLRIWRLNQQTYPQLAKVAH